MKRMNKKYEMCTDNEIIYRQLLLVYRRSSWVTWVFGQGRRWRIFFGIVFF